MVVAPGARLGRPLLAEEVRLPSTSGLAVVLAVASFGGLAVTPAPAPTSPRVAGRPTPDATVVEVDAVEAARPGVLAARPVPPTVETDAVARPDVPSVTPPRVLVPRPATGRLGRPVPEILALDAAATPEATPSGVAADTRKVANTA